MSRSKYEIYVEALLDYYLELKEKRDLGLWHIADELSDLEKAVDEADLTRMQRQCIHYAFMQGMRHADVGAVLGVTRQSVDYHVNTAIRKIANIYRQWEALEYAG